MRVKRPDGQGQISSLHLLIAIVLSVAVGIFIGSNSLFTTNSDGDGAAVSSSRELLSLKPKGWSNIHIHYGDVKGLGIQHPRPTQQSKITTDHQWFAQVRQDKVLLDLIGPNGYFIDLAANDAVEFSNTLALETYHGWNGLCIEPNPGYWYKLAHRKCTVIGALVGGRDDTSPESVAVQFRGVFGGRVDTMDSNMANRKKEPPAPTEQRYTASMASILQQFGAPTTIDYLSLDVEGAEYLVMENFPYDKYTIRVLTIERPTKQLKDLLQSKGYFYMKDLVWWGETLWAHKSTGFTPDHPKIKAVETELNPDDVRKAKLKNKGRL